MRTSVPITPRWIITGRWNWPSSPTYSSWNWFGRWKSTWMVLIVSLWPSGSRSWMSIFGP